MFMLSACRKCFDDAHAAHRDAIMLAICNRAVDTHPPVKRAAFGCLNRVADIYYKQLEPYIDHIAGITSAAAMGDDEVSYNPSVPRCGLTIAVALWTFSAGDRYPCN